MRSSTFLPADLRPYFKQLISPRTQRRDAVLPAIRRLSSEQLISLANAVKQHLAKINRRMTYYCNPVALCLLVVPIMGGLIACLRGAYPTVTEQDWGRILVFPFLVPMLVFMYYIVLDPRACCLNLAMVIAERDELCLLGAALDLDWRSPAYTYSRMSELDRLLLPTIERMVRRMDASDYATLTRSQKETLLGMLPPRSEDLSLAFALLERLKTVTDDSAVGHVLELAYDKASTPERERLRSVAQECLAMMQAARAQEHQSRILLRASEADNNDAVVTLLRPTSGTQPDASPDRLLRAVHSEAAQ